MTPPPAGAARTFFAPGKVVLLGEYAVLDGAPALVAAVDRGVGCRVVPGPWSIVTPPGTDDRFVRPALEAVDAPAARYHFYAQPPPTTRSKPGLGSSAAATVVAALAGSVLGGAALGADPLHRLALQVHHRVQGSGSGIDVAAAAHGGVLRFERGKVTAARPQAFAVAFSGTSASTGPRVQHYLRWTPRTSFVEASRALVDDPAPLHLRLRHGAELLGAMAGEAGIAYWTPGLRALCDQAEAHGGGAKPSGAGGGDVVVAEFPDPDRRAAWVRAVTDAGFQVIPTELSPGAHEGPPA